MRWYALHVHSNCERVVVDTLDRLGIEQYFPERFVPNKLGKVVSIDARRKRPLFPGYVFGRFNIQNRTPVVSIPQVVKILGIGSDPMPIDDTEIESVRILASSPEVIAEHLYLASGTPVRVKYGPLHGAEGIVTGHGKGTRLVVSLVMLGRSLSVPIDAEQLIAIPDNSPMRKQAA